MDRDLLATIPAGVSAGLDDGGLPVWGLLGSVILATTATGTHGPGALVNDGLTPSLRYVPVLMSRTDPAFMLYPDGSYDGPVPSSAVYALYEEGTGNVAAPEADRTITITGAVATVTLRILDKAEAGSKLAASAGWDFFWYDDATTMAQAVAGTPTISFLSQSIGADGKKVLALAGSTKTSGQSGYLMFSNGARSFAALVEVD